MISMLCDLLACLSSEKGTGRAGAGPGEEWAGAKERKEGVLSFFFSLFFSFINSFAKPNQKLLKPNKFCSYFGTFL